MNISDLVNNNSVMKAGLRADTARAEIEYKNQLKKAGDIYVGTGNSFENDGETICVTEGKNILTALNEEMVIRQEAVAIGNDVGATGSSLVGLNAKASAYNTVAVGNYSNASGNQSIAIGAHSNASAVGDVVIGNNAAAINANSSVVIGNNSRAVGDSNTPISDAVVIGNNSKIASGWGSTGIVIIGSNANASENSVCIGSATKALQNGVSIGNAAKTSSGVVMGNSALSANGVSIGTGAKGESHAITIGTNASTIRALSGIAIGRLAKTETIDSIVIGNNASVLGEDLSVGRSVVIGNNAKASAYNSVVIGNNASSNSDWGIVIGNNASLSTGCFSIGIGRNVNIESPRSIVLGDGGMIDNHSDDSISIGGGRIVNSLYSMAILGSLDNSNYSFVAGNSARALNAIGGIALGDASKVQASYGIAIGGNANVEASEGLAIGQSTSVSGNYSIAIGPGTNSSGNYSIAIGDAAFAFSNYSTAIGFGAQAGASNNTAVSLRYANKAWTDTLGIKIANGATAWSTDSDERIKDNIELANTTLCLDNIRELPVKRYSFKDFAAGYCDEHQVGFIAQDLEKFYPKLVHHEFCREFDDPNHPGEKIKIDDFRSIEKEPLIPVLWGGIQELAKRLEAAENKIAELEKNK